MKKFNPLLYLVTDSSGLEEKDFLNKVEQALKGGVTLLQLREKEKSGLEFYNLSLKVKKIADFYDVPLIINDRADIALAVDADGVHLGQSDIPVFEARKMLGPDKIIGASTKTIEQAKKAENDGADYLGVGAIFPTTTKVITVITPVKTLDEICRNVKIPAVAIGGLNKENINVLKGVPISGVSVVSAVMKSENPFEAARDLKTAVTQILNGDMQ
ncbi:MAG: thiamine-phosphate diphosphorylase [Oscillospiraceae bacterium]|jgi:thiamine-phosphate pyrophosphorylase|nr:thiamine-phosphate diphosphorylase [Oscillospiraceae bacterium]